MPVTPPPATVERAWQRGLTTQRYKAVDDLLYHNVEAFTGIPELFFSWMSITDKDIYFEFLDNDVPLGKLPKTIAFGRNGSMTVLDPVALSNIDRFKEVNLAATHPEDVLRSDWTPTYQFLKQCTKELPRLEFADQRNGQIYGKITKAQWKYKSTAQMPKDKGIGTCVDHQTGKVIWRERIGGATYFGSPVSDGKKIFCVDADGVVRCIAAGDEFQELGQTDLGELCRSTPAIAHGNLYLRTMNKLFAVKGR